MNNKCMYCNEVFDKKMQTQRFCSSKCRVSYHNHKKKNTKSCARCGEDFIPTASSYIYCSEKCRKEKTCKNCGKKFYPDSDKVSCCSDACRGERQKRTLTESDIAERFNERFSGFEYHSGYTTIDNDFNIVCLKCGHIFKRNAQCIRPSRLNYKIECNECIESELREKQLENLEIQKLKEREREKRNLERTRRKLVRTLKDFAKYKRSLMKEVRTCAKCGVGFEVQIDKKTRCCSKKCQTSLSWSENKIRRRRILFENGPVDREITLQRLAIRDNMLCHICGIKVDMNAHFNSDEYGSIDHIRPIAKGGTHTWNNVALAHRGCNTKKCDSLVYDTIKGQMRLSL